MNFIITTVLLMALWFIMSGKTEPKFIILGVISSVLVAAVCSRALIMKSANSDKEYYLAGVDPLRFIIYFFWLIIQIIKAALSVSVTALSGKSAIDSSIAWFKADYDNPAARALLANSITLTPGTITIDITDDGIFSVHALTKGAREGLLDGSMQAKVAWVYHETIDFAPLEASDVIDEAAAEVAAPAPRTFRIKRRRQD